MGKLNQKPKAVVFSQEKFIDKTEWFKQYMNDPEYIKLYPYKYCLDLVAEAAYLSNKLGLAPLFQQMSLEEIKKFDPTTDIYADRPRRPLVKKVFDELTKPYSTDQAIYALEAAAWAIRYKRRHLDPHQEVIENARLMAYRRARL